jgi:hypothetical protein
VEHGQYTVNGRPVGDKRLSIRFDLTDEFLAEVLRLVEVSILDGGGDPGTLRHVEFEVWFEQETYGKYRPVNGKLSATHG